MLIPLENLVRNYQVKPGPVLHVGAHVGEEAEAYNRNGFMPVWWIEANEDVLPQLRRATRPFPHQHLIHALVTDEPKRLTFHVASNGASSSYMPLGTHAWEHPDVTYVGEHEMDATTVDLLWADGQIQQARFMSMDVQGAELDVLRGSEGFLRAVEYVYAEVNTDEVYEGCPLFEEVTDWLGERGFERRATEMTPHHWGDALYVRVQ